MFRKKMRVAIIGAGASGLCTARHVRGQGFDCVIFEKGDVLGGTWVYTDDVNLDKDGYPVHTAMYKDLRTNLCKDVMCFPDFPMPEVGESFLSQEYVLGYLNRYAEHFKLLEFIRFEHMVTEIHPEEDKWQVKSFHKITKKDSVEIFNAVIICNGHFNTPHYPSIEGQETFQGKIIHSHQYRSADSYKNQKVLVVGAGFSGLDVAVQLSSVAHLVVLSQHNYRGEILSHLFSNVIDKPQILRIKENGVEFIDNSYCPFDSIIFCTGYRYNIPFLSKSCDIKVEDNYVYPLYKHIVNIERPSMAFIGLPFNVCVFPMIDIQVRYYCQYLNGSMVLPSKEIMHKVTEDDMKERRDNGFSDKQMHLLGRSYQQKYFDDLAMAAKVTPVPAVVSKMWNETINRFNEDIVNFRKDRWRMINNESFVRLSF